MAKAWSIVWGTRMSKVSTSLEEAFLARRASRRESRSASPHNLGQAFRCVYINGRIRQQQNIEILPNWLG